MNQHDLLFNKYVEELRVSIHMINEERLNFFINNPLFYEERPLELLISGRELFILIREYWLACHKLNARNYKHGIKEFENPHYFVCEKLKEMDIELYETVLPVKEKLKLKI